MRVLITGARGYLGSFLSEHCCANGFDVCLLDRTSRIDLPNSIHYALLDDEFKLAPQAIIKFRPDWILHCAAATSLAGCERTPKLAEQANVHLTKVLLDAARQVGAALLLVSTDLVFDGNPPAPEGGFNEKALPMPASVYAHTKRRAEELVLGSSNHTVLRSSLIFGPPASSGKTGPLGWLHQSLQTGAPVCLFFDEWRTPIYVHDLVRAIVAVIYKKAHGLFHCGGPIRMTRLEFGQLYARSCGLTSDGITATSRLTNKEPPPRPKDVSLNSILLQSRLSISLRSPEEAFEELAQKARAGG